MKLKWIWFAVGMILTAVAWMGFLTDVSDDFPGTFAFLAITAAGILVVESRDLEVITN